MSADSKLELTHGHHVPSLDHHERRTRWVVGLTASMMVVEIVAGYFTNSLALLADGWHMATHAGALGISAFAYWFARTRSKHSTFTFGTGKVYALAGYTNAVALLIVAVVMVVEAAKRLVTPELVSFREAIPIAIVGLLVNLLSAKLLDAHGHDHGDGAGARHDDHADDHHHDHDHDHDHDHPHQQGGHDHDAEHHTAPTRAAGAAPAVVPAHHDHNLRSAYLHVIADAFTSVLAIAALVAGKYLGVRWLDPVVAALGSVVIAHWAIGLCRQAAGQLLDVTPSVEEERAIRKTIEALGDERVVDLHLWELGPAHRGCIVSIVASEPRPIAEYRAAVLAASPVQHLTIEVHRATPAVPHAPA